MIKSAFSIHCFLLFMALLPSCAPYVLVEGKFTASTENFEVDLPSGWRKHDIAFDHHPVSRSLLEDLEKRRNLSWDALRITRDGLLLQQIAIGRLAIDKELPYTKRKFSKGMLPQEVAGVIIDNIRSNPNITNQQVMENLPAQVGGAPGFKLLYTYRTKKGLTMKVACYGVMLADSYYYLLYEAPARHYFAIDYSVFEKVKETFRIVKSRTA